MHSVWVTKAFHDPCIGRSLIKEGSLCNKKFYVLLNIVYFGSESAYLWHYRINNFISREFAFNRFKINFGLGQTLLTLLTYCPTDCMYEQSFCKWVYCLSVDFFVKIIPEFIPSNSAQKSFMSSSERTSPKVVKKLEISSLVIVCIISPLSNILLVSKGRSASRNISSV